MYRAGGVRRTKFDLVFHWLQVWIGTEMICSCCTSRPWGAEEPPQLQDQYSVCPLEVTCSRRSSSSAGEIPVEPWPGSEASISARQSESTAQLSEEEEEEEEEEERREEERRGEEMKGKEKKRKLYWHYWLHYRRQTIRWDCTWVAAESWSRTASSLRSTGSPSGQAGGEQVVLLHTVSCLRGAQQAAHSLPAADTGAEAAAPVSGATGHALEGNRENQSINQVVKSQ